MLVIAIVGTAIAVGGASSPDAAPRPGVVPVAAEASTGDATRNVLDRPYVDIDFLDPARPSLAIAVSMEAADGSRTSDVAAASTAVVEILERNRVWRASAHARVQLEPDAHGQAPWLVRLFEGSYALLRGTPQGTTLVPLRAEREKVTTGEATRLPGLVAGAAVTDVDADGAPELVLSAAPGPRPGGQPRCEGTVLTTLDAASLAVERREVIAGQQLGVGGVIAEIDGRPGSDLAVLATACPAHSVTNPKPGLLVLRLNDGTRLNPVSALGGPWTSAPLATDFDDDGRHEIVGRIGQRVAILDPARGWVDETVAADGIPLVTVEETDRRAADGGLLVVATRSSIELRTLARGAGGRHESTTLASALPESAMSPRWHRMLASVAANAGRGAPANALWLPVEGPTASTDDRPDPTCTSLLVPLAMFECDDPAPPNSPHVIRAGPALVATRPLALVGPASDRVLSAETSHWQPGAGELVEPAPLIAWSSNRGWRGGPSVPFQLGEVSRNDVSYFSRFPQPTPTVDRFTTGVPPRTYAGGWNGMRFLIRARALGDAAPYARPSLEKFLRRPAVPGEGIQLARSPVLPGDRSGIKQSFAEIGLPRSDDPEVDRWLVELVEINAWGEISGHLAQVVARDVSAPRLVVEVPSFTPPWPFAASLDGEAEPGATVSVAGGSVTADRLGRFTVPAQLAPWPQTIEVRAVDRSGNESVRQVSVVGGFDYRQLPWALIGTLVLVAVLALGPGRRTTRRAAALAPAGVTAAAAPASVSSPESPLELDEEALAGLGPLDSRAPGSAFIEDVPDTVRTVKVRRPSSRR